MTDRALELLEQIAADNRRQADDVHAIRLALEEALQTGFRSETPCAAAGAAVLTALAAILGPDDDFDCAEVFAHARADHRLDEALKAARCVTTADLGALFRSLNGKVVAGLRLVREGRRWRLEPAAEVGP